MYSSTMVNEGLWINNPMLRIASKTNTANLYNQKKNGEEGEEEPI